MSVILNPYSNTQLQNDLRKLLANLGNATGTTTRIGSGAPTFQRGDVTGNTYWDQLSGNFWIFNIDTWVQVPNTITLQIQIVSGSPIFKNHSGTVVLQGLLVEDGLDASAKVSSWQWTKNGANVPGGNTQTLTVSAADIDENSSNVYSVYATY